MAPRSCSRSAAPRPGRSAASVSSYSASAASPARRASAGRGPGAPATTALAGTSLVTTVLVPTTRCRRPWRRAGCTRRSRSSSCGRRARRACRCPAGGSGARPRRRRGRSRSASRGRRRCTRARSRRAGRRRSCTPGPSTVFAPISTSPSCARIFVPWPIHDQRPSRSTRVAADLELHARADEAQPVGLQPPAPAQLQPRPAQRSAARSLRLSIPWRAHEAQRARAGRRAAAPGAPRTCGGRDAASSTVAIGG